MKTRAVSRSETFVAFWLQIRCFADKPLWGIRLSFFSLFGKKTRLRLVFLWPFSFFCARKTNTLYLQAMIRKLILLATMFCLTALSAFPHSYMFRHLEVADGLSNNTVYAIHKDAEGFLWFGTRSGLNRFDGYTFKVYRHLNSDDHSLPDNCVTDIQETPDGRLWIKTERSYALFDKSEGRFVTGFAGFMIAEKFIKGVKLKKPVVITLLALSVLSVLVTPYTPMYKVRFAQTSFAQLNQSEIDKQLEDMGYEPGGITEEDILSNPEIHQVYEDYYRKMLWSIMPNMFERFTIDEIMAEYGFTTDAQTLINVRQQKSAYASMMWKHSDTLTHFFGIDVSDIWLTGSCDLENDWPAIFYYYGYLGFGAYLAFIAYFALLIIWRLFKNFKTAFTTDNFILLITFLLFIGLAQFSGSVLRRPNVSFYMALVLGLIYYQTRVKPVTEENSLWRKLQ